jgi:hypothetical protein
MGDHFMIRMVYRAVTGALLLAGAGFATVPAQAQQVLSYEQVRDCYCTQQGMTRWRGEVAAQGDVLRARQVELDQAKRQLAAAQASANPNNEAQLDNIRNLIDRVGQLRSQLQTVVVPSYNNAVTALTGLVNHYNTLCVPNIILKEAEQQVAASTTCPMQ